MRYAFTSYLRAVSASEPPVRTLQEFADRAEVKAAELFGSTTHLAKVQIVADQDMPPSVGAAYREEDGGEMLWRDSSAKKTQAFLDKRYLQLSPTQQLRFLSDMRLQFAMFFHELVHSEGVASLSQFTQNMQMDGHDPRVLAVSEGLTSVISDTFLDQFIQVMGLDQIDPRLMQVSKPLNVETYPGLTEATFVILMAATAKTAAAEDRTALKTILSRAASTGERFEIAARNSGYDLSKIPAFADELSAIARSGNGAPTLFTVAKQLLAGTGRENDRDAVRSVATVVANGLLRVRQQMESGQPAGSFQQMNVRGIAQGLRILQDVERVAEISPRSYRPTARYFARFVEV